jgi:cyclic pyranopterin phosphate synthase
MGARDVLGRGLRSLRLSVTDRCNLRCSYCMPEQDYVWLPHEHILRFEELARLAHVFAGLGVDELHLTGGEPLLRRDLPALVRLLAAVEGVKDLALTTNGVLLAEQAGALRAAGLSRVTISLDTLRRECFERSTRRDELARVLAGIDAARAAGFEGTKLNAVVMRGVNDDELVELLEFARSKAVELRFIEYMDVGGATRWRMADVVSRAEVLARLAAHFGSIEPEHPAAGEGELSAPAERFRLPDGTHFGVIASTTAPFCARCDRSRLTADGMWFTCLYAPNGTDLRGPLRAGATDEELAQRILGRWRARTDRGAEERLASHAARTPLDRRALANDPHLEMHTRGG